MSVQNYQDFIQGLSPEQMALVQEYARNRVMEPYEGQSGLETLQEASVKLTHGINRLKSWKDKVLTKVRPEKSEIDVKPGIFTSNSILRRLKSISINTSKFTRDKLKELEPVLKELSFDFIRKGIELTAKEDYDRWILASASKELNRPFTSLEQIRELNPMDRRLLVNALYPYRSKRYQTLLASFDKSVSLFLGALVATNLPGTGILVSLINISKTIVRLSNRINCMSILFGHKVENPAALFEIGAMIIKSIENWEKYDNHQTLDPMILEKLYLSSDRDVDTELKKVVEAAGIKDLYIAIPGIGMLSLGKINLDNLKIDLTAQHLVQDYFFFEKIRQSGEFDLYQKLIADYQIIYGVFKDKDYFEFAESKLDSAQKQGRAKNFQRLLSSMIGSVSEFEPVAATMMADARLILDEISNLPEDEKQKAIEQAVQQMKTGE